MEKFYSEYSKMIVLDETSTNQPLNEDQLFDEFERNIENHVADKEEKVRRAEINNWPKKKKNSKRKNEQKRRPNEPKKKKQQQ